MMAVDLILYIRKATYLSILLCLANVKAEEKPLRWSRQISNAAFLNDWVPVQPRQASGRVLNFGPPFPPPQGGIESPIFMNAQQSQSVALPQSNLEEPFQRVFFQQMHPPQPVAQNQHLHIPVPQNQQFHLPDLPSAPFRPPPPPHEMQLNNGPQHFLVQHAQPESLNHNFKFPQFPNQPPAPQLKPEFLRNSETNVQSPHPEQLVQNEPSQLKNNGIESHQPLNGVQPIPQEEVQLLYVPLDTLYHQQQDKLQNTRYHVLPSSVNPLQINNFYTQQQQKYPATITTPTKSSLKISSTTQNKYRQPTTQKPVHRFSASLTDVSPSPKPKTHQPPLAMFMKNTDGVSNKPSVNDVLSSLAYARSIDVLDSVSQASPEIFVGPSGLSTPDGYSKFELPYLSSIEQNRAERQINSLPFFVAPLSYRAPKGFAKIPLPSPHVGSVVVNSPANSIDTRDNINFSRDNNNFYTNSKYHSTSQQPTQYTTFTPPTPDRTRTGTTSRFRFGTELLPNSVPKLAYQSESVSTSSRPTTRSKFNSVKTTTHAPYTSHSDNNNQNTAFNNAFDENNYNTRDNYSNKQHTNYYATLPPFKQFNEEIKHEDDGPSKFILSNAQPSNTNTTSYAFQNEEAPNTFANYYTQNPTNSYFNTPEPVVTTKQADVTKYEVSNLDEPSQFNLYTSPTPAAVSSTSERVSSEADDVHKMKTYFREQDAFKVRPAISTPATYYETSTTRTSPNDKGFNDYSTSTPKFQFFNKEQQSYDQNLPTTPRTTVTYYTAAAASDEVDNQRLKAHSVHQFRFVESVLNNNKDDLNSQNIPKTEQKTGHEQAQHNQLYYTSPQYEATRSPYRESHTVAPLKHQQIAKTEIHEQAQYETTRIPYRERQPVSPHNQQHFAKTEEKAAPEQVQYNELYYTSPQYEATRSPYRERQTISPPKHQNSVKTELHEQAQYETTRSPYHERQTISPLDENTAAYNLPSNISPIASNLPGLVNSLMEKDGNTTPVLTTSTTPTTVAVTTRRSTLSRGRRPQTTNRNQQTDSTPPPEITTRRPINRGRRPINYANRTTTLRTTTLRSPNRFRYNPTTTEERTRQRTRARTSNRPSTDVKPEENIDYQRDVLKQNYPVVSHVEKTISKSPETVTEITKSFVFDKDVVTPSDIQKSENEQNTFSGLTELEYPQKYDSVKDEIAGNFNTELQKSNVAEDHGPIFVSTTTLPPQASVNQEEITEVLRTRKPSFIRRIPSLPTKTSSQKLVSSTEIEENRTKERSTVRSKPWHESSSSQPRVTRPRIRSKRPIATPTTTVNPIAEVKTDQTYQQINSFNKDFYRQTALNKKAVNESSSLQNYPEKRKNPFRFTLSAEESQWSTKFNSDSFQPVNQSESVKSIKLPEIEIVTASSNLESDNKETYSFNVEAASFFDLMKKTEIENVTTPQTTLNDLIEDVAHGLSNESNKTNNSLEHLTVENTSPKEQNLTFGEFKPKSEPKKLNGKRRGVWKRVRVRPADSFETAESQNIGKHLYNALLNDNAKEFGERNNQKDIDPIIDTNLSYEYSKEDSPTEVPTDFEETALFDLDSDNIDVHTDAPAEQLTETSTESDELSPTTIINREDVNTTPAITTDLDEREESATSTVDYEINNPNDLTTTSLPDIISAQSVSSESTELDDLDKSTEKPEFNVSSSLENENEDQLPQPSSLMDEVKQKLTQLFSFEDDDVMVSTTERVFKINRNLKRPKTNLPLYTTIERKPLVNEIVNNENTKDNAKDHIKPSSVSMKLEPVPVLKTVLRPITEASSFHKDLMDSVIYATSTSTEISHETEICYRGRCVKTLKTP